MAFMLAHARACLPPSNCSAWIGWQSAHVSSVGVRTRATSSAVPCPSPRHRAQWTPVALCRLSSQSVTTFGVASRSQSTQAETAGRASRPPHAARNNTTVARHRAGTEQRLRYGRSAINDGASKFRAIGWKPADPFTGREFGVFAAVARRDAVAGTSTGLDGCRSEGVARSEGAAAESSAGARGVSRTARLATCVNMLDSVWGGSLRLTAPMVEPCRPGSEARLGGNRSRRRRLSG